MIVKFDEYMMHIQSVIDRQLHGLPASCLSVTINGEMKDDPGERPFAWMEKLSNLLSYFYQEDSAKVMMRNGRYLQSVTFRATMPDDPFKQAAILALRIEMQKRFRVRWEVDGLPTHIGNKGRICEELVGE